MLKRRTLYVSDLDGTLLNTSSEVSATSALELNRAIERGALFSIATARTPATVIRLLSEVRMQLPGVVMTGAALYDFAGRRFRRLQYLPEGVTSRLVDIYREMGVGTFVYTYDGDMLVVYHVGEFNELERGFISQRAHTRIKRFVVSPDGDSPLPRNLDNTLLLYSVQPWEPANLLFARIKREVEGINPLCYHDTFGEEWAQLEVFGASADKAKAVEALASQVYADRIVAFGDNVNDLPLFELADEGVAVANAIPELRSTASEVIGTNDADSVAHYILSHTAG